MEQEFMQMFTDGMVEFFKKADWLFIVCNMIWVFVIKKGFGSVKTKFKTPTVTALNKIPGVIYVVLQSILLAVLWSYLFSYNTKEQFTMLFFSITVSMIAWQLFFAKLFKPKT